ncbi:unnamed protein product [Lactuca saligna]|uniref:Protein transport protein SEC23 n=1 Tax=Lactuca saligna TaxID=75948 RepID=A0AA36E6L2_LACSI|nr:unnamed protein product [Lactuca saligna]
MCYKPTPLLRILKMTNLTLKTVVALMIIPMIHPGEMWLSGLMEGSSIRTEEPVSSSSSSLGAQCVPPNVYHIGYGAKIKRSKSKQLENEFNQLIHSEKDEMQDMQVDSSAIISLIVGANNQEEIVVESIKHAKEAIALDVKDGNSWYNLGNACLTCFFVTGAWDHSKLHQSLKAYQNVEKDESMKSNPNLYFNSATVNTYLENYERALSGFEAAVASKNPCLNATEEVQKMVNLFNKLDTLLKASLSNLLLLLLSFEKATGKKPLGIIFYRDDWVHQRAWRGPEAFHSMKSTNRAPVIGYFLLATTSGKAVAERFHGKLAAPFEKTKLSAYALAAMVESAVLSEELMQGFDHETVAVVVARLTSYKMEMEESFDATRWIDRNLICLCSKFGDYRKDDPSSFSLNPSFSLFPQFMFNLRRSQFVQVLNDIPDETAYFRMMLNRESITNATVMIQPSLILFVFVVICFYLFDAMQHVAAEGIALVKHAEDVASNKKAEKRLQVDPATSPIMIFRVC